MHNQHGRCEIKMKYESDESIATFKCVVWLHFLFFFQKQTNRKLNESVGAHHFDKHSLSTRYAIAIIEFQ